MSYSTDLEAQLAAERQVAVDRVKSTDILAQYEDILLEYDWEDSVAHNYFVARGNVYDILVWAQAIRRDEEAQVDSLTR